MRKSIITQAPQVTSLPVQEEWLDLENLARVEVTSEHPDHPVESALTLDGKPGWLASQPGEQTIRLLFDQPLRIRQIHLLFHETEQERTQEFELRWLRSGESTYREILRQQFSFSPPDTTREVENYAVDLDAVAGIELTIVPDIREQKARARLTQLRLA